MSRVHQAIRRAVELAHADERTDTVCPDPFVDTFGSEGRLSSKSLELDRVRAPRTSSQPGLKVLPGPRPAPDSASLEGSDAQRNRTAIRSPEASTDVGRRKMSGRTTAQPGNPTYGRGAVASHKLVLCDQMAPATLERYRQLAATLQDVQVVRPVKVIMVASAASGEGRTLTAANLALTLSESYKRRVLLVDADLRRPGIHILFDIDNAIGLSEALAGAGNRAPVLRSITPTLDVVTGGQPIDASESRITSFTMRRFLDRVRDQFDWIIVDSPPVLSLPDVSLLATAVDGAIFVIKANTTPLDMAQRALDRLGRTTILGAVLNAAEPVPDLPHEYSYLAQRRVG